MAAAKDSNDTSPRSKAAVLSQTALMEMIEHKKMTAEEVNKQRSCLQSLTGLVKGLGPDWHVRPFGSSANGFGMTGSDLDVTCFRAGASDQERSRCIRELQSRLLPIIEQDQRFEVIKAIWTARVPIVKLKFEDLDVDLSCQNTEALVNTELLKIYSQMNELIRALVVAVKLWAKSQQVCGSPQGHLSSYSLTLMVIYFLQVQPDLKFPVLPTEPFSSGQSAMFEHFQWECSQHLSGMVARFFSFYAWEFKWGSEVVSVRLGSRQSISAQEFGYLHGKHLWRLHVEDPFLRERNLNCVLGSHQEAQLQTEFQSAAWNIFHGRMPNGLHSLILQSLAGIHSGDAPTSSDDLSTRASSYAASTIQTGAAKSTADADEVSSRTLSDCEKEQVCSPKEWLDCATPLEKKEAKFEARFASPKKIRNLQDVLGKDQEPGNAEDVGISSGFTAPESFHRAHEAPDTDDIPMTCLARFRL